MADERLDDFPEAIPLRRVAPGWRVFAILMTVAAGGFFLLTLVLFGALVQHSVESSVTFPPPPVAVPATVTPVEEDDPDAPKVPRADLPYPSTEDLRRPVDHPDGNGKRPLAARERFLNLGKEAWRGPRNSSFFTAPVISPDGGSVACFAGPQLIAGPLNAPQVIDLEGKKKQEEAELRPEAPAPPDTVKQRGLHLAGAPAWSADSAFVYFATAAGRIMRLKAQDSTVETLPVTGRLPAPLGDGIVFVRSTPVAKVGPNQADPGEVVLADREGKKVRVLVPASNTVWRHLAVAPDGRRLALVSETTNAQGRLHWQLVVVPVSGGKPEVLTTLPSQPDHLCWAPDGKALLYGRMQETVPADCRPDDGAGTSDDLFLCDLVTRKETRLSRGGGFGSPSVAGTDLFFLTRKTDAANPWRQRLRQVPLDAAWKFAAAEPEPAPRGPAEWNALLEQVCTSARVPAGADGGKLDAETMARLAGAFRQQVRERFKEEVPDTAAGLDRLWRELQTLRWGKKEQRAAFVLVFGAVQGDFLCRKHGAVWQFSPGPLARPEAEAAVENAFARAMNLFHQLSAFSIHDDDEEDIPGNAWPSLEVLLQRLEGRTLVLVNDPARGREAVAAKVDPDLARAGDLLDQGKGEEGEELLLSLIERGGHARNWALTLQVGELLHRHDRKAALRRLLERPAVRDAASAPLYNLLGVSFLEGAQPQQAGNAFKKALRCDLHYGPAYFNLATAYEKHGDQPAAKACLRRYLELLPGGPLADDALARLGRLEAKAK